MFRSSWQAAAGKGERVLKLRLVARGQWFCDTFGGHIVVREVLLPVRGAAEPAWCRSMWAALCLMYFVVKFLRPPVWCAPEPSR